MAKINCEVCGSSDAVEVYEDHTHCYSCGSHIFIKTGDNTVSNNEFKDESWEHKEVDPINTKIRGISPSTFKQYGYGKVGEVHAINHTNKDGKIVAQKFRYKDKTFSWGGNAKAAIPFGLGIWRSGGKRITITEGELDCLSVAEALSGKYPVISINNGAQAAKKDLAHHIEMLNSYDEVTLWFDNDEPGRKAVQEVSSLFPPGKVTIIQCKEYKDANQALQEGGKTAVLKYYYETKLYTPDGIVAGNQLDFDNVVSLDTSNSYKTPYEGFNDKVRGLRKGELVTFTAGSGMGKTTMVREIAYDLMMTQDLKIGWVALEENTQRSALGFMSIFLDTPIYLQEEREKADNDKMQESYEATINNNKVFFYDHWGSLESDNLVNKLRYLAVGAEVDFIFLDHISIVVSGGNNGDNERVAIDNLMTSLRSLAEETKVGIVIISHLRRAQGDKGFENGHEVTLSHLRGSGGIAQLSDTVVALERDQQAEEDANVGNVRILKNRYTGEVGLAGKVKYYKDQGRLLDYKEGFDDESEDSDF